MMDISILYGLVYGLIGGVLWGVADPLAAWGSKNIGLLRATAISQLSGVLALAAFGFWNPYNLAGGLNEGSAILPSLLGGATLGLFATLGYIALYQSYLLGPLSVVSPIVASNGAITIALMMLFLNQSVSLLHGLLLVTVLAGVFLLSLPRTGTTGRERSPFLQLTPGILLALVTAVSFGVMNFSLAGVANGYGWYLPLLALRISSLACTLVLLFFQPVQVVPIRVALWSGLRAVGAGLLDTGGLALYAMATRFAASPASAASTATLTITPLFIAVTFLKERIGRWQFFAITLILLGLSALPFEDGGSVMTAALRLEIALIAGALLWLLIAWLRRSHLLSFQKRTQRESAGRPGQRRKKRTTAHRSEQASSSTVSLPYLYQPEYEARYAYRKQVQRSEQLKRKKLRMVTSGRLRPVHTRPLHMDAPIDASTSGPLQHSVTPDKLS